MKRDKVTTTHIAIVLHQTTDHTDVMESVAEQEISPKLSKTDLLNSAKITLTHIALG